MGLHHTLYPIEMAYVHIKRRTSHTYIYAQFLKKVAPELMPVFDTSCGRAAHLFVPKSAKVHLRNYIHYMTREK